MKAYLAAALQLSSQLGYASIGEAISKQSILNKTVLIDSGGFGRVGKVIWIDEIPTGDIAVELSNGTEVETNIAYVKLVDQ